MVTWVVVCATPMIVLISSNVLQICQFFKQENKKFEIWLSEVGIVLHDVV